MSEEQYANLFRMLRLTGGKYIIVEDGVPKAVLMDYDEFQKLAVPRATEKIADRINEVITKAQLLDLREEVMVDPPQPAADSDIRIEPL